MNETEVIELTLIVDDGGDRTPILASAGVSRAIRDMAAERFRGALETLAEIDPEELSWESIKVIAEVLAEASENLEVVRAATAHDDPEKEM